MASNVESVVFCLLRASLATLIAGVAMRWLLTALRIQSPRVHRAVCVLVLVQGWLLVPWTLEIPYYDPIRNDGATAAPSAELEPLELDRGVLAADVEIADAANHSAALGVGPRQATFIALAGQWSWDAAIQSACSLLLAAWLAGMFVVAAAATVHYLRFLAALRTARPAPPAWRDQWQSLLEAHCTRRTIPLLVADKLGPMLCLTPSGHRVVVPRRLWEGCTASQRLAILRHELAHYERGDIVKSWLVRLLALPQWFNPAARRTIAAFEEAGEWSCDAAAANFAGQRVDYLQALERLIEFQPPQPAINSLAGKCAHSHPLVFRVRRLIKASPVEDSIVRKFFIFSAMALLVAAHVVRVELVARAADGESSAVEAVKRKVEQFEDKIAELKDASADLKEEADELGADVDDKVKEIKALAKSPDQWSAEGRRRVELMQTGGEKEQLEAISDADKLKEEGLLLIAHGAKDSAHDKVRQKAIELVGAMGEAGYPAMAIAYESLTNKERVFLAEQLGKNPGERTHIILLLMAKEANDELFEALLAAGMKTEKRLQFVAVVAGEEPTKLLGRLVQLVDAIEGDDGALLLYAAAKSDNKPAALEALKIAAKRKDNGLPAVAAAFKHEDAEIRAAVVATARKIGGEAGQFVIDKALSDPNEKLRAAAEKAVEQKE